VGLASGHCSHARKEGSVGSDIGGVLQLFGLQSLEGAVLIIVLGAYLIVKPWLEKRKLFGKAEES
jgi:hypothetical protein